MTIAQLLRGATLASLLTVMLSAPAHADCVVRSSEFVDAAGAGTTWRLDPLDNDQSRTVKFVAVIEPSDEACVLSARLAASDSVSAPPLASFTWNGLVFTAWRSQRQTGDGDDPTAGTVTIPPRSRRQLMVFAWRIVARPTVEPGDYPRPLSGDADIHLRFRLVAASSPCGATGGGSGGSGGGSGGGYAFAAAGGCPAETRASLRLGFTVDEALRVRFAGCDGSGSATQLEFAAIESGRFTCMKFVISANAPLRIRFGSTNGARLVNVEAPTTFAPYSAWAKMDPVPQSQRAVIAEPAVSDPSISFNPAQGVRQQGRLVLKLGPADSAYRGGIYRDTVSVSVERQ